MFEKIKAIEYLKSLPCIPMFMKGNVPIITSNSEKKRWLDNKSVIINEQKPRADDLVELPVLNLIFFPKKKDSICTMLDYYRFVKDAAYFNWIESGRDNSLETRQKCWIDGEKQIRLSLLLKDEDCVKFN